MTSKSIAQTIERLDKARNVLMPGDGEWSDAEEMDACVTQALALLDTMRWREVREELPEHDSPCLFAYLSEGGTWLEEEGIKVGWFELGEFWKDEDSRGVVPVTYPPAYWQPLPLPPEKRVMDSKSMAIIAESHSWGLDEYKCWCRHSEDCVAFLNADEEWELTDAGAFIVLVECPRNLELTRWDDESWRVRTGHHEYLFGESPHEAIAQARLAQLTSVGE